MSLPSSSTKKGLHDLTELVYLKINNYKCDECGSSFFSLGNLKSHQKSVHLKIKNHICRECGYGFSEKRNLEKHNESVHFKVKTTYMMIEAQFLQSMGV